MSRKQTGMNSQIDAITRRIIERSKPSRERYLARMNDAAQNRPERKQLSCSNLAHGMAVCGDAGKDKLSGEATVNVGIVTAYNDMLSAHHPFKDFPDIITGEVERLGHTAQVAGATPAMCDGVTQGQPGMELSLFSRDVIAQSTAVALSHAMFDSVICLGVCDKIVPGLLIGTLTFGHLPVLFAPAGPMTSGLSNDAKAAVRMAFAKGEIGRDELLKAEAAAYHSEGTCTFYGTANSNQMLMEFMGLHAPGGTFANPGTPLRHALTRLTATRATEVTQVTGNDFRPMSEVIDERSIVNAIVGLMATGGSTNHAIHLVAIAAAAGIRIDWTDMAEISAAVPLLARVYPNGSADVNHFDAAGGLGFVLRALLDAGLVHGDARTMWTDSLEDYGRQALLDGDSVRFEPALSVPADTGIVRPADDPFSADGGLKVLDGNLGRAVIKTSAVNPAHHIVEAPAVVFETQQELQEAFKAGDLNKDFIAVVRFQGPSANGMPELHKLTPPLAVLQNLGYKVALVTDGRMSGASGKVPAAIHLSPEGAKGGAIARVQTGDMIRLDAVSGELTLLTDEGEFAGRTPAVYDPARDSHGLGRELFSPFRTVVNSAEEGAHVFGDVFA